MLITVLDGVTACANSSNIEITFCSES